MSDIVERLTKNAGHCDLDHYDFDMAADQREAADEIVRLRQIVQLGVEVRTRQKVYFKSRDRGDLIASKEAESAFDKAAKP